MNVGKIREQKQRMRQWVLGTSCRVILFIGVVGLGVLYVVQTSVVSTKGYDIDSLRREVTQLEKEDRRMQISIAEYRSIQRVVERVEGLGMVPATDVAYVTPTNNTVAKR